MMNEILELPCIRGSCEDYVINTKRRKQGLFVDTDCHLRYGDSTEEYEWFISKCVFRSGQATTPTLGSLRTTSISGSYIFSVKISPVILSIALMLCVDHRIHSPHSGSITPILTIWIYLLLLHGFLANLLISADYLDNGSFFNKQGTSNGLSDATRVFVRSKIEYCFEFVDSIVDDRNE